jgi:hypothetical protein
MIQDIIIGAVVALIGAIIGAFLGYLFSEMGQKKERLINGIYRPLLGQVGNLFKEIEEGKPPDLTSYKNVMQDGLYVVMKSQIREAADLAFFETKNYKDKYDASKGPIDRIIKQQIEKLARAKDLEKYRGANYILNYTAFIEGTYMGGSMLRDSLLRGKMPAQVLIEKRPVLKNSNIISYIGGYEIDRKLADSISQSSLKIADEDQIIKNTRSQRIILLDCLEKLIILLKKEII